jgi:hypothetical protein
MKSALFCLTFVLTLALAPDAWALKQSWGGAEDDWSMPTADSSSAPTVTSCRAYGSKNQRCRACKTQYWDNGEPTGYVVCAYVPEKAACNCNNVDRTCYQVGTCYYY